MKANISLTAVMELDLEPIKAKLMHVASGEGWSREKADAVEKEYRRFLCLMKLYPHEETAPLADVDTFWHYHILDTMKYAQDCEQVFGYFLHHYPYVGMRGGDDAQFRLDSGERMRTLYEATFGEAYPAMRAKTAFCGGPVPNGEAVALSFCGGPVPNDRKAAAVAFCGGPVPNDRKAAALAFCGGPVPNDRNAAAIAFCGGPVPNGASTGFALRAAPAVRDIRIENGAITWQASA
ncbi:hypothetical protein QPK32_08785 [Massilia sp. YIM B02763]|uniref:glycine-rich domain-containing protein n=1 Tax=Massilia sp. YIM B02763 TaxID=3050130 RepID=UPI0025B6E84F|nr:hypothetical protein [Massilia sp. YIM B02763]MDN4053173.1 hypothetical protein [Massilia sp. YIM B02763]